MQQTILFKVPGKPSSSPVVILSGPNIGAKSSTPVSGRLSRALSMTAAWVKCNCTPVRIVRALFSARVSTVVAIVCIAAMWWHNVTVNNTIEAQEAVGFDCLLAMPWAIVWAFRATHMSMQEKGGED